MKWFQRNMWCISTPLDVLIVGRRARERRTATVRTPHRSTVRPLVRTVAGRTDAATRPAARPAERRWRERTGRTRRNGRNGRFRHSHGRSRRRRTAPVVALRTQGGHDRPRAGGRRGADRRPHPPRRRLRLRLRQRGVPPGRGHGRPRSLYPPPHARTRPPTSRRSRPRQRRRRTRRRAWWAQLPVCTGGPARSPAAMSSSRPPTSPTIRPRTRPSPRSWMSSPAPFPRICAR